MSTLKDCVVAQKCRTGKADGTTKRGAFWLACEPIKIRRCGGDGIGNNRADVTYNLHLRHYRSGEVQVCIERDAWHQNGSHSGCGTTWESHNAILDCQTVEDVIVALKAYRFGDYEWSETVYSDRQQQALTEALTGLGLPETAPAPDEAATA